MHTSEAEVILVFVKISTIFSVQSTLRTFSDVLF